MGRKEKSDTQKGEGVEEKEKKEERPDASKPRQCHLSFETNAHANARKHVIMLLLILVDLVCSEAFNNLITAEREQGTAALRMAVSAALFHCSSQEHTLLSCIQTFVAMQARVPVASQRPHDANTLALSLASTNVT